MAIAGAHELIIAIESGQHVKVRRMLNSGVQADSPHLGILPLAVAVEREDIACVALLLWHGASPDKRAASSTGPSARDLARRMLDGQHAVRLAALSKQRDAAVRILRLFDAPCGDECSALVTAFGQRLDALEQAEAAQAARTRLVLVLSAAVLAVLYTIGLVATLISAKREQQESIKRGSLANRQTCEPAE